MTRHIRIDDGDNAHRQFACGIGPALPDGDDYLFEGEYGARLADCPGCNPGGATRRLGTPISDLSTQPNTQGYAEWLRICESWGRD